LNLGGQKDVEQRHFVSVAGHLPKRSTMRSIVVLKHDVDGYVQALAALSLAVHRDDRREDIMSAAARLVSEAIVSRGELDGKAASIALFAAAIIAGWRHDRDLCRWARPLATRLAELDAQRPRAQAIDRELAEIC
jgi:hypothetical protein